VVAGDRTCGQLDLKQEPGRHYAMHENCLTKDENDTIEDNENCFYFHLLIAVHQIKESNNKVTLEQQHGGHSQGSS
jgi:hypothetical protein